MGYQPVIKLYTHLVRTRFALRNIMFILFFVAVGFVISNLLRTWQMGYWLMLLHLIVMLMLGSDLALAFVLQTMKWRIENAGKTARYN